MNEQTKPIAWLVSCNTGCDLPPSAVAKIPTGSYSCGECGASIDDGLVFTPLYTRAPAGTTVESVEQAFLSLGIADELNAAELAMEMIKELDRIKAAIKQEGEG